MVRTRTADRSSLSTSIWLTLLVAVGLACYVWVWPEAPIVDGDSPQYMEVARDLTDFRLDELHDRSPGYPLLVMLTGASTTPARPLFYASLLLHGLSIWLLARLLSAAGVPTGWQIAFAFVALLPPFVEPTGYLMTENLAQTTLVVGLAAIASWWSSRRSIWLGVSALALGYSAITRPAYQGLGFVVAIVLFLLARSRAEKSISRRAATVAAGAVALGPLLMAGGLSVFNQRHFGYFGVVPTLGFHLTTKTILFIEQAPDEFADVRDVLVRERAAELVKPGGLHDGSQTVWNARADLIRTTGLTTPQLSSRLLRMNLALVRHAPVPFLRDLVQSLARYWLPAAGALADFSRTALRALWLLLHVLVVGAFFLQLIGAFGLALARVTPKGATTDTRAPLVPSAAIARASYVLAGTIVLYTMAITCLLDIGEPRQRRATDLLILFMVVLGAHIWRQLASSHPATSRAA